jgi:excisionase family DNA binding protein
MDRSDADDGVETVGPARESSRSLWLTATEAAAYLGFPSRRALYMSVRRGQVPVHRLGRRMRFFIPELDAALRGEERFRRFP